MNASNTSSTPKSPDLRHSSGQLVLVGAGKMGGALLDGWLRFGIPPANVAIVEPQPSSHISAPVERGVRLNPDAGILTRAAAIVIAVKPQIADEAMQAVAPMVDASTLVVSIMAGRTLHFL